MPPDEQDITGTKSSARNHATGIHGRRPGNTSGNPDDPPAVDRSRNARSIASQHRGDLSVPCRIDSATNTPAQGSRRARGRTTLRRVPGGEHEPPPRAVAELWVNRSGMPSRTGDPVSGSQRPARGSPPLAQPLCT